MTITELKAELNADNIKEKACLILPTALVEGALCLTKTNDGLWRVTLNERGEYLIDSTFSLEHEACRFFLEKAMLDPTYRNDFTQAMLQVWAVKRQEIIAKYGFEENK